MTLHELIDKLEEIADTEEVYDPEVYFQTGTMSLPVHGVKFFPESGVNYESVVISNDDDEDIKLVL